MAEKVCLITGVGPGTGAACARRFAEGYRVAMLARNAELGALPDAKFVPRRRKGGGSFAQQERKKATARKAVAKARKHDFFLGLDKRWLDA